MEKLLLRLILIGIAFALAGIGGWNHRNLWGVLAIYVSGIIIGSFIVDGL